MKRGPLQAEERPRRRVEGRLPGRHRCAPGSGAQEITDTTVTLVKDDTDALPLAKGTQQGARHRCRASRAALAERDLGAADPAATAYEHRDRSQRRDHRDAVAQAQASDAGRGHDQQGLGPSAGQQKLVKQLVATGKPVVVVAVRDPYDIAYFTDAPTYLATYSTTPISIESLARVIFGEVQPSGTAAGRHPHGRRPGRDALPLRPRPDLHVMTVAMSVGIRAQFLGARRLPPAAGAGRADRRWLARPLLRPRPRPPAAPVRTGVQELHRRAATTCCAASGSASSPTRPGCCPT